VITGSARGLGREMALSYAKAGASGIAVLDVLDTATVEKEIVQVSEEARRPQPVVIRLTVDITSLAAVEGAAESIKAKFGTVDILVNNAGYLTPYTPLGESDPEKWWRSWEVNVKGVYLMTRCFLPLLLQSQEKTMIVLSSVGAHHTLPGGSSYESTKLAVLKINNYLMAEYGPQGLLAYAVAPGGVKTDMIGGFPAEFHHLLTDTPRLVADTITFLTQERREWLGARYVDSRWDMTELLMKKDEIIDGDLLKVKLSV
jgi:NAD(P)-dependent dehydrogenase (short-subunit alcohol dehydrogenase family)